MKNAVERFALPTLLTLLLVTGACGGSSSASEATGEPSEGGAAAAEATEMAVHAVGDTATYTSFPVGPEAKRPSWTIKLEEAKRSSSSPGRVVAKLTYQAGSDCIVSGMSVCGVSPRHFHAVLADGTKVTGSTMDLSETPKLESASLQPNESKTGYVGFELPAGSGDVTILYEPYPGQVEPQFGFAIDAG